MYYKVNFFTKIKSIFLDDFQSLDYETTQVHTVVVEVTESTSGDTALFTLTVNVGDINEADPFCNPQEYNAFLNETTTTNLDVKALVCTDADSLTTITYSVKLVEIFFIIKMGFLLVKIE